MAAKPSDEGNIVIDIVNVCSNSTEEEKFEFKFKDGSKISGKAKPGEIKKIIRCNQDNKKESEL